MTSLALGILENKVEKDRNDFEIKSRKIINKIILNFTTSFER